MMNNFHILLNILVLCVILFSFYASAQNPPLEETCPNAPKNLEKLNYVVYYNGATPASIFLFGKICKSYQQFKDSLSTSFKIGAYVGLATGTGKIVCPFYENEDCTVELQHACASVMLSDFKGFICCNTAEGKKLDVCVTAQGETMENFNNCVEGKNPSINPQQILLDNANKLNEIDPTVQQYPAPIFNGKYDSCTFIQAQWYWLNTVCKMYADPRKPPCP